MVPLGTAGAAANDAIDGPELFEVALFPTAGADLSLVTAFFNDFPFLISPNKAFLSGVILGSAAVPAVMGGGIPGGGGGGGGGGAPIV